jgi:F-type H+-transporting ATPase subunit delta
MPSYDDRTLAVARVYGDAILGLARKQGREEEIQAELAELEELYHRDENFRDFVDSPLADPADREKTLERLLRGKGSDLLVDSIQILNRKQRLALLPAVAAAYDEAYDELRQRVKVRVTSATPLNDAQRRRLTEAIHQRTGKEPVLTETVDESILGGLVVRIGDHKIDSSVAYQLENLSHLLRERVARQGTGQFVESGAEA